MSSVMALRALPRCWAQLVGVLGQVKMYLGLIVLIKTYSPLFAAIGGWDGMDAGGAHWMTCAIFSTHDTWALAFVVGGVGDINP